MRPTFHLLLWPLLALAPAVASARVEPWPGTDRTAPEPAPGTATDAAPGAAPEAAPGGLVPPRPLRDSPAPYPPELAAAALSGEVKLELLIDERGEVAEAVLVDSTDARFDPAALHAAVGLLFQPATLDGQPTAVRVQYSYRFVAPERRATPTGVLKGQVRSMGNRRPVPGAALLLEGSEQVVQAGADGEFELSLPPGKHTLKVTSPAFLARDFVEELKDGETLQVVYALMPRRIDPYETVVRGERDRTEISRVSLQEAEIRDVPGTMGDPFRVVMLMPGVGTMASGVAYPVVRGTQPSATGYYMDGIRVPILFHLFLGPAVVHPDFIDSIDFIPGAPPPEYGRILGGVINGKPTRPRDDRLHATAYMDLINAGGFVEYPLKSTGTSFSASGRVSYSPWLLALMANTVAPADVGNVVLDFYDYQTRVEQKLGGGRKLRLLAFGSSDKFGTEDGTNGARALQSILFHRLDLRYEQPLGRGDFMGGITGGIDRFGTNQGDLAASQSVGVSQQSLTAYARYALDVLSRTKLLVGADVDHKRATMDLESTGELTDGRKVTSGIDEPLAIATFAGAWTQVVWTGLPGFTLIPGLRLDHYGLDGYAGMTVLEPRVSFREALSESVALKGGFGVYHQAPSFLISVPVIDVAGLKYGLQEAMQFDTGVEWKLTSKFDVGVDTYFNPLLRSVELNPLDMPANNTADPTQGTTSTGATRLAARGQAWGVELLLRHPLGDNWFGWISYSYQQSRRFTWVQRTNAFGELLGTEERWVDFAFDQTHVLNFVLSYRFEGGWTVGGVAHLNSGRPQIGEKRVGVDREDRAVWLPVDRDKVDRLPPFFRVDARVSKTWAYDDFTLEWYLDVMNATLSTEVQGNDYVSDLQGKAIEPAGVVGFPIIIPSMGVKARY